jgi:predicted AlkP superfamily pyrophosphatase or phosphodiesterase
MFMKPIIAGALLCTCMALAANGSAAASAQKPKLILQITVDQLRGDLPERYMKNMGEGGFRYLKDKGVWYHNAHYGHSNTETVVGHTTLATGADPSEHGMVSNVWFDRDSNKLAYNIEDERYKILSSGAGIDKDTEVDSSQALASTDGRSPANILVSTFSDELTLLTNGQAKVFAVSVKDRGAVPLAGHSGKAFWFSKASGEFITSSYYYERYPDWVSRWNQKKLAHRYDGKAWNLLLDQSRYTFGDSDDAEGEADIAGFGTTFPHAFKTHENKYFGSYLTFSPAGDELTLDFAKALIEAEDLGQDEVTDFLAISFSSTDYIGHLFGPSSLEMEDNLLRLDRTLAELFAYIDETVGLDHTLIVLSADHGGPETPAHLKKFGINSHFIAADKWDSAPSIARLKQQFGIGKPLIRKFYPPYIYLDHEVIAKKGLDLAKVQAAVAREMMAIEGVALAVSSRALLENRLPDTWLNRAALRNFHPKRSGDVLILFAPHVFITDFDGEVVAANHGGAWEYDRYVPVIFAGYGLQGQAIDRAVEPRDIAPTLARLIGAKPPSGASGTPLPEVLGK